MTSISVSLRLDGRLDLELEQMDVKEFGKGKLNRWMLNSGVESLTYSWWVIVQKR